MALGPQERYLTRAQVDVAEVDVGLRQYMLSIYNYMASGLALTGIVAYALASSPALMQTIYGSGLVWIVMLAPLGFVFALSLGIQRMKAGTAQALFWAFAVAMGLSLASIFLVYTGASIARVFFISAGTFAGMSLVGYTTRRDLSGFGGFLFMGLIGLILASLVNLFIQSSAFHFALSVIGVIVFVGLTAYDTQRIKELYFARDDSETAGKKAIMGALTLYLDFINIFLMLLRLFGERR
ncbi:MAG: Bax inhibitor-1/YccA family protein [Proteobacteria bacterium]|nr:Bax inhibitor-1/YccA family protein [Pseudomonadota bacterium]